MSTNDPVVSHAASAQIHRLMRDEFTFQISVDNDTIAQGLLVAEAALAAGITIVEMGTPLHKFAGARNAVPAFRERFPEALLLADMKTMDGGAGEARTVYAGGGNIIDFMALAGIDTAKAICKVRDEFRETDPVLPRLAFADILLPHLEPNAADVACAMLDAGVDGIGVHLQLDARRANPDRFPSNYLADVAHTIQEKIGERASVQVVGGLAVEQACDLARAGIKAIVISGNLGLPDAKFRLDLPQEEIQRHIAHFMQEVRATKA